MKEKLNLGYAVPWSSSRELTWSGTPWHLEQALSTKNSVRLTDLPLLIPDYKRVIAMAKGLKRAHGRWASDWVYAPIVVNAWRKALREQDEAHPEVDAILAVGEFGATKRPLFLYQDFSFLHAMHIYWKIGDMPSQFTGFPVRLIEERAQQQQATYDRTEVVFTMSEWDRDLHIEQGFLKPDQIVSVGAGVNALTQSPRQFETLDRDPSRERRVLFVGRDFYRKGGGVIVEAVKRWEARAPYKVRLTIAGPKSWPMPGAVPTFVDYIGDISKERVKAELANADVLALPSFFEAFGIAIIESLAAGVPVVGRNLCAMPELIEPGVTGALVDTTDPDELAEALEQVSNDDTMRINTIAKAAYVRDRFSWSTVADTMIDVIKQRVT